MLKHPFSSLLIATLLLMATSAQAQDVKSVIRPDEVPSSLNVLETPPAERSARFVYDQYRYYWGRAMRDTPRGAQALEDCDCSAAGDARAFSPAFGVTIDKENTPELFKLVSILQDASGWYGTTEAKEYYKRTRPFIYFNDGTCKPSDEEELSKNGSYPSGHTAGGFAVALVLAEINPDNQDTILRRGIAFGESRVICGYHWQSDVDAGYLIAAGVVARLHASEAFQKQLAAAKQEFAELKRQGKVKVVKVER